MAGEPGKVNIPCAKIIEAAGDDPAEYQGEVAAIRAYANGNVIHISRNAALVIGTLISAGIIQPTDVKADIGGDYYPISFNPPA